ncbi:hypothetical protein V8B97DRAFT_1977672 [Scleroderma yunnanense]
MVNQHRTPRTPRKQKRKSLASRAHLDRLMKEAASAASSSDCEVGSSAVSTFPSTSACSSRSGSPFPGEASTHTKGKGKAKTVTLNYSNVLLIERFQAAVESRTAICRRLEQLVRHSPIYTPAVQNQLVRFLRDDFIRGDKTLQIIENLKHSDFISASPSEDGIDIVRQEVTESTKMLFEGSKELMTIGDQIATSFS